MKIVDLVEAFNTVYTIKQVNNNEYVFDTPTGTTYQINLFYDSVYGYNAIDVSFGLKAGFATVKYKYDSGEFDGVSGENYTAIFGTVINFIREYIRSENPDCIYFSGKRGLASVYERMLKREHLGGYVLHTMAHRDHKVFALFRSNVIEEIDPDRFIRELM